MTEYFEMKFLNEDEFDNIFNKPHLLNIMGMPSYYTITKLGQFKVWPSFCLDNPLPKLGWKF